MIPHTFKLSFPNLTSTFIHSYPSTLTTLVRFLSFHAHHTTLIRAWALLRVCNFWKFTGITAIHFFKRLMLVEIQIFLYQSMK